MSGTTPDSAARVARAAAKRRRRAARPLRDEMRRSLRALGLRLRTPPLLLENGAPAVSGYIDHPDAGMTRIGVFLVGGSDRLWTCKAGMSHRAFVMAASLEDALRLSLQALRAVSC